MIMWIVSSLLALAGTVATALLKGFSGFEWFWTPLLFAGYLAAVIALLFICALLVTAPVNLDKPVNEPSAFYTFLYNCFDAFLCSAARIKVRIHGLENLDKDKKYLFVYNHRSNFDPMIISRYFRRYKILMISKPQNFRKPLAGKCIHKAGFMPIDREDDREALKTVLKAAKYLGGGYSVGVAPEGTRNKRGTDLLPFRNGCFKIAQKAKAPVCVLTLNGTEKVKKNFPLKRTLVYIDVSVIGAEEVAAEHTYDTGEKVRREMTRRIEERNGVSLATPSDVK